MVITGLVFCCLALFVTVLPDQRAAQSLHFSPSEEFRFAQIVRRAHDPPAILNRGEGTPNYVRFFHKSEIQR